MRESLALYRPIRVSPSGRPPSVRCGRRDPRNCRPATAYGLRFAVPLVEMPTYLPDPSVESRGRCPAISVTGPDPCRTCCLLHPDVVVNAAGMAAGALVATTRRSRSRSDRSRRQPRPRPVGARRGPPGGRAYVHPRTTDCILGGTLEVGEWNTSPIPR